MNMFGSQLCQVQSYCLIKPKISSNVGVWLLSSYDLSIIVALSNAEKSGPNLIYGLNAKETIKSTVPTLACKNILLAIIAHYSQRTFKNMLSTLLIESLFNFFLSLVFYLSEHLTVLDSKHEEILYQSSLWNGRFVISLYELDLSHQLYPTRTSSQ